MGKTYKFKVPRYYSKRPLSDLLGVILLTPEGKAKKTSKSQVFIGTLQDLAGAWIKDIMASMKYSIIAIGNQKTNLLVNEAVSGLSTARQHITETGIETSLIKTQGVFPPQPVSQYHYHVNVTPKTKHGDCFLVLLVYRQ